MRFWIDKKALKGDNFVITDDLYHHICRVAKIKKGERFELFCEGTQKYEVSLSGVSSSQARAHVHKVCPVPPLKPPYLKLAVSLPQLGTMESLLEKAVQMGVKDIQPLISEFSFFKKSSQLKPTRLKRWQKIVQSQKALSARSEDLKILPLKHFLDLEIPKEDKILIAYESSKNSIKKILSRPDSPSNIRLFIGSEGGFSLKEIQSFKKLHPQAQCFSLGDQILKVENASLFALSLLKYHYHL